MLFKLLENNSLGEDMDMFRLLTLTSVSNLFMQELPTEKICSQGFTKKPKSNVQNKHHSRTDFQACVPVSLGPDRDHAFHLHLGVINRREHLQRPFDYYQRSSKPLLKFSIYQWRKGGTHDQTKQTNKQTKKPTAKNQNLFINLLRFLGKQREISHLL